MGLTFLLLGIGFASPLPLALNFPPGMWEGKLSLQALNLYALTVFLGWGHFFYAFQGQWRASIKLPHRRIASYWAVVIFVLAVLVALRGLIGVGTFSLIAWVYNIAHFIKAERHFSGRYEKSPLPPFFMPSMAFAWFTIVLFHVGPIAHTSLVFSGSLALAAIGLLSGDWKSLASGDAMPLLTFFLLGETLLWDAYDPTPSFIVGVYVVHVAAASFFHYLSGYSFAQRGSDTSVLLKPAAIVTVNIILLLLGCAVARFSTLWPLKYLIAPEWFTLWVALHLITSDLLPVWKRQGRPRLVEARHSSGSLRKPD